MDGIIPFLEFDGNCREAMAFYAQCLGAKLELFAFSQAPANGFPSEIPESAKDRIMHASLTVNGLQLLASDRLPGGEYRPGDNVAIFLSCETLEEIERIFAAFSEGATIAMALQDTFWGARFGVLTDRFGIRWSFNCALDPVPRETS